MIVLEAVVTVCISFMISWGGALIGAGCAIGVHTFIRSRKLPAIFIQAAIIFYENWEHKLGLKPAKQVKG
ncbi:hypothetical protein [Paenibacillus sp. 23TSA30-6]|uniref:hypothetical protein n=1 Tax=Paenibacillus sp. 23TSA30-6 TaxID=2546104 RepID=UPI001EE188C8|nr:hypothetical protein [Paenibacillus sp. 23TSA30-6]